MIILKDRTLKRSLHLTTALIALSLSGAAFAADSDADSDMNTIVVTDSKATRSSVDLGGTEIQTQLPGINPLKAIETLPGVVFMTADPWGANEQNESLYIHGFNAQQLGYTMDGVPLGDASYGEWNGMGLNRAVTSENVGRVNLATGAGSLGIASTSNLGGAVETFSSDPLKHFGGQVNQTFGSYDTYRTFARADTGDLGFNTYAFISYVHQDAKAWDFDGHQGQDQVNVKLVHEGDNGKLTVFADISPNHIDPNEDSITLGPTITNAPYTRPYGYPNLAGYEAYVAGSPGLNPAKGPLGSYFPNYFSAEQREDELYYAKYEWNISDDIKWTNLGYFQNSRGRGIVGGPAEASFPTYLPAAAGASSTSYFAGLTPQQVVNAYGGSGIAVRTTEYTIDRSGLTSNLDWELGNHSIETGLWYENNFADQMRRWYPFSAANNDLTPYDVPSAPTTISGAAALALLQSGQTLGNSALTQYGFHSDTQDLQYHLQDQWQALPDLLISAGFKTSQQWATGEFVVQQPGTPLPNGTIKSNKFFLPQIGAVYDLTKDDHLFFNVQENLHQLMNYGAGGLSAWSTQSQSTFNNFKNGSDPEHAWVYETGYRFRHELGGFINGVEGQVEYYHVDFSNRLLNITSTTVAGQTILGTFTAPQTALVNVGGVTTNGVDIAGTVHFGDHFSLYDGLSYNDSTYNSNYCSSVSATGACGAGKIVATSGKNVAADPKWTDKVVLSANYGPWEGQLTGDYVGSRYATYLNDQSVGSTFVMGLQASYTMNQAFWDNEPRAIKFSLNVTNLNDEKGWSTIGVTQSGNFTAYPVAPRMFFGTVAATF